VTTPRNDKSVYRCARPALFEISLSLKKS